MLINIFLSLSIKNKTRDVVELCWVGFTKLRNQFQISPMNAHCIELKDTIVVIIHTTKLMTNIIFIF